MNTKFVNFRKTCHIFAVLDKQSHRVLPTAYLPPVAYFYFLLKEKEVLIEQYETYPKQTYRNRCEILTANGKLSLSIPIEKPEGNHTKTNEALLSTAEPWPIRHWRSIQTAYQAAPFFLYYQDELEAIYLSPAKTLLDFNLALTQCVLECMGTPKDLHLTTNYIRPGSNPQGTTFQASPKEIQQGLEFPTYTQVFEDKHGFTANASIIDALFNLGPETITYLRGIKEVVM